MNKHQSSGSANQISDYISDEGKENYSDESNGVNENEMKRKLFDNLKRAGVLDGMKSTLRVRLYEQLQANNNKAGKSDNKAAN